MSEANLTFACIRCHEERPIERFPKDLNSKRGFKSVCKDCFNSYARMYRQRPESKIGANATKRKNYARVGHTEHYKERQKRNFKRWHERSPRLNLHMALRHATKRRLTLRPATTDELMEMWKRQNNKCAVSGVEMTWGKGKLMPTSISLDRYDGTRGYELDNIRLVCYQVNTFRGRWSDEQMLEMARAIVANMERQEPPVGMLEFV